MEPVGAVLLVLTVGGVLIALGMQHKRALEQAQTRVTPPIPAPAPSPIPSPPAPGPGPGPGPSPTPTPTPTPSPEEDYIQISEDTWQDYCWWTMESPADVYMEIGRAYYTTWPSEWQGAEDLLVYIDPPELADVQAQGVWQDGELYIEVILIPKQRGWGTLMATEGTPGPGAVKGETPWRADCMKVEVV